MAFSLIERNLFNYNRHSLAGTGRPGSGYNASHNVEIGVSLSHMFDMHGGRNRKDGTDIAGTWMKISNNTFRSRQKALMVSGLPEETIEVHHNWFIHGSPEEAVLPHDAPEQVKIDNNAYGLEAPEVK